LGQLNGLRFKKVHEKKMEEKKEKKGLEERNLEVVITCGEQYDVI